MSIRNLIPRKQMSMAEPILQIFAGCCLMLFVVGIFFIIKGIKNIKDFSMNNIAGEYCLGFNEATNQFIAVSIEGNTCSVPKDSKKMLYYSPKNGRLYLTVEDGSKPLDLGFCHYSEYRNFITANIL